jgi:BNR/Asp-box repeat
MLLALATVMLPGMADQARAGSHRWTSNDRSGDTVADVSASATDANIVFAVLGHGVESTHDGGHHWRQFFVPGSANDFLFVAVAPSDPQVVYVANPSVWRTGDGGLTWTHVGKGAGSVYTVAVDPADPNTVYVGNYHGRGVHVSTDGGLTWQRRHHGLPGGDGILTSITPDPSAPGTLYVGTTGNGIFKTTNYGKPWKPFGSPGATGHAFDVAIDPADPDVMFAAMEDHLFRTVDGGKTWTDVLPQRVQTVIFDPVNPANVYTAGGTVDRSTDGGLHWHEYNQGLVNNPARAITIDGSGLFLHIATNDGAWDRAVA